MRVFRSLTLLLVLIAPAAFADGMYQVELILFRQHGEPAATNQAAPEDWAAGAQPLGADNQTSTGLDALAGRTPESGGGLPALAGGISQLADGAALELAGLTLRVDHTPGHTPGSVVFSTPTEEGVEVVLAGDTLFAGSIGRTDLPGGDHQQLLASLRDKLLTRPDDTVVLPGHGPTTTVGRERASNPFLQGLGAPVRGRGL